VLVARQDVKINKQRKQMKRSWITGLGIMVVAVAMTVPEARADTGKGKYEPLRAALTARERELVVQAREARVLADEFNEFLNHPDTETEEKPALREKFMEQESRCRHLRKEAVRLRAAAWELRSLPNDGALSYTALKDAHEDLGELGGRGTSAWEEFLAARDDAIRTLNERYADEVAQTTAACEALDTEGRANKLLLDAIDFRRADSTDAEFQLSLQLPRVVSEVQLGFGLYGEPGDEREKAQMTLLALVGYSQFFWDYWWEIRAGLPEGELPADSSRNIFGVRDGCVLMSDAIARSSSNIYYLSEEAKEAFNGRIQAIWGTEGTVSVSWWNQNRARGFARACESLATRDEQSFVPEPQVFELLEVIDDMIEEKARALEAIESTHTTFRAELAEASGFGDKADLSTTSFNASLWAKSSERTMERFMAAQALLDRQLAAQATGDWTPDTGGIVASAQALKDIHGRLHSVRRVKQELAVLLR
jgi:hypothetical protein